MFYYATGIVPSQWNRLFAFLARSGVSQQFLNVRTIVDTNIRRFVLATGSTTSQVCSVHLLAGFELSIFRKDGTMLLDRFKLDPAVLLASSSRLYLFGYFLSFSTVSFVRIVKQTEGTKIKGVIQKVTFYV